MPIITRLTVQKKNTERFNVYIDYEDGLGEVYAFSVDHDTFLKYKVQKGRNLSQAEIDEIITQETWKKAFTLAIQYLSYRMRSKKEIISYLHSKEFSSDAIERAVNKLSQNNYIDDLEFAKMFVRSRLSTTSKGPLVIKQELEQKGISKDLIEKAMVQYDYNEQMSHAIRLVEKKIIASAKKTPQQIKEKLYTSLLQKGFSIEVAKEAIQAIDLTMDEDAQWDAILVQGEKAHNKYKKWTGYEYEQKMKQYLFRRGFSSDIVNRFIANKLEEE